MTRRLADGPIRVVGAARRCVRRRKAAWAVDLPTPLPYQGVPAATHPCVHDAGRTQQRLELRLLRRVADIPFLSIHFDFTTPDGAPLMSVERQFKLRDRYIVTVPDERVDFRVAAAIAVGLDALMPR